jgi:hypothetical protein
VFKRLGKLTSEQLLIERKKYIKQRLQKATILKPIVDQLSRELFISIDTIYRDIKRISEYKEDVLYWLNDNNIELTDEELKEVYSYLEYNFDSNSSYWENIEFAVETIINERDLKI